MNTAEVKELYAGTSSSLPAYRRIQVLITAQISSGNLKAGDSIPSENDFVNALGISRMTVNRAMRELSTEGLLSRTRGIGTFVAEPKYPGDLMQVHNIADQIKERGHSHTQELLKIHAINSTDDNEYWQSGDVPQELGDSAFHSVIVHFDDGVPFQIEERFVSAKLVPDYMEQDFTVTPPATYLRKIFPKSHGVHSVDAILPSTDQCDLLKIDSTEPCLRIERSTYVEEKLVSQACLLHPGSLIKLEGEFSK